MIYQSQVCMGACSTTDQAQSPGTTRRSRVGPPSPSRTRTTLLQYASEHVLSDHARSCRRGGGFERWGNEWNLTVPHTPQTCSHTHPHPHPHPHPHRSATITTVSSSFISAAVDRRPDFGFRSIIHAVLDLRQPLAELERRSRQARRQARSHETPSNVSAEVQHHPLYRVLCFVCSLDVRPTVSCLQLATRNSHLDPCALTPPCNIYGTPALPQRRIPAPGFGTETRTRPRRRRRGEGRGPQATAIASFCSALFLSPLFPPLVREILSDRHSGATGAMGSADV